MPLSIRPFRRFPVCCTANYYVGWFLKLPLTTYFFGFCSLIALLILSVGPAYAEWVWAATTGDGTNVYIDPDTIRRKGSVVKMWHLYDFKTARTRLDHSFLSSKGLKEYDCVDELIRVLRFTWFSGNMGSGEPVFTNSEEDTTWEPVAPESAGQIQWKFACDTK